MTIVTNFQKLATNSLRKKALEIAEVGYEAIGIEKLVNQKIKLKNNDLSIRGAMLEHSINLDNYKSVFTVGIGKGSALACATLAKILNRRLTKALALDIQPPRGFTRIQTRINADKKLEFFTGTHPLPSRKNLKATQEIIKLAKNAGEKDLIISFICGGGSALLCGSQNELNTSQVIFKELTKKGADIIELNTIRKHLSEVKGGGLAKIAYPATMISLIVSDVPGNNLSMVASGPTVFDKTTIKDAEKILAKFDLPTSGIGKLIETPKDKRYFEKAKNVLFLSNHEPILAMQEKAQKLGFKAKIYSLKLNGEAKNSLLPLVKAAKNGEALLAAGETTVKLNKIANSKYKIGKGGRNMESVLGIIDYFDSQIIRKNPQNNWCVLSFSSDGHDNTEAAGAIADFSTIEKVKKLKLDSKKFLRNHDSFNFFKKTGNLIFTEPKTFNVADLMIILKS